MIKLIRKKILGNEYLITSHAQKRCDGRGISLEEIKYVISTGEIIEEYPDDVPYPSFLILGYVRKNEPLYVLIGHGELVHIITVHWLDPDKWLNPRTRRENKL